MRGATRLGTRLAAILLSAVMFATIAPVQPVEAAPFDGRCFGGWGGRTCTYFDNARYYTPEYYRGSVNYVITTGAYMRDVESFIGMLYGYAYGPTGEYDQRRNQTGAAFIIHTLLGRNGDQANAAGGRNVSAGDFNEVASRLRNANINFDAWVCGKGNNTMSGVKDYAGSQFDVMRTNNYTSATKCEAGITIRDSSGNLYELFDRCANPAGTMDGIAQSINYDLTPTISVSPGSGEPGNPISVTPGVSNSGATVSSGVNWWVTKFTVPPGNGIPGAAINGTSPPSYYSASGTIVSSGNQAFPRNATTLGVPAQSIDDLPVGTRICYGLTVSPYRHDNGSFRHSTPACVVVAKKPKVQVIGGDLSVGRSIAGGSPITANVITSTVTKGGNTYGSWTEYGVLASGTVTGMGSGASYSGGTTETNLCRIGVLTFTNTRNGTCKAQAGGYAFSSAIGGFDTYLPRIGARTLPSNNVNLSSDIPQNDIGRDVYTTSAGSVSISGGGAVPAGKSIIINAPDTTITITGNIIYTNAPLSSVTEIPQVVIIARNIIISSDVDRIDAWLIATGTGANGIVNTCGAGEVDQGTSRITANTCDSVLRINGPVMANHLLLRRTAGAGTGSSSGDPAEVINLRADAYMWALARINLQSSRVSTVLTKELPPRF